MTEQAPINTENAVAAPRPKTPIQQISETLDSESMAKKIESSLAGTGISPERFKRSALALLARPESKYLVENCDRGSIYASIMSAATLGLELAPQLGHASIVPRGGQAVLQVQFKGKLHLAQQHPKIAAVGVGTIHEKDTYELVEGTHPELRVRPALGNRGAPIAYYCITHYRDGVAVPTVMTKEEIEQHRDRFSDAYKRGGKGAEVWKQHFDAMAHKTVVHRASKLWPLAIPGGDDDDEVVDGVVETVPAPRRGEAAKDITPRAGGNHLDAIADRM